MPNIWCQQYELSERGKVAQKWQWVILPFSSFSIAYQLLKMAARACVVETLNKSESPLLVAYVFSMFSAYCIAELIE